MLRGGPSDDDVDEAAAYEAAREAEILDVIAGRYDVPDPPPGPCICRASTDPSRLALDFRCPQHGVPGLRLRATVRPSPPPAPRRAQ
jgi:hypothetical protein